MSASLGHDLVLHGLPGATATSKLVDPPMQTFQNGRHEDLCQDLCGNIINDETMGQAFSPNDLIEHSLRHWKDCLYRDTRNAMGPDTYLPLSDARLDMAAYTYTYHMPDGCNHRTANNDCFWMNQQIRRVLLHRRVNVHEFIHRTSCFKKDCEC